MHLTSSSVRIYFSYVPAGTLYCYVVELCTVFMRDLTYPLPALDGGVTGGAWVTSSTLIRSFSSSSSSSRVGSLAIAWTTKSAATPSRATHQGRIMAPYFCNYLSPFSFSYYLDNLQDITYRNVVVQYCISCRYHWLTLTRWGRPAWHLNPGWKNMETLAIGSAHT